MSVIWLAVTLLNFWLFGQGVRCGSLNSPDKKKMRSTLNSMAETENKILSGNISQAHVVEVCDACFPHYTSQYETCALVGSSGRLCTEKLGAEIDSHKVVARINFNPILGMESWVGRRTDIMFARPYRLFLLSHPRGDPSRENRLCGNCTQGERWMGDNNAWGLLRQRGYTLRMKQILYSPEECKKGKKKSACSKALHGCAALLKSTTESREALACTSLAADIIERSTKVTRILNNSTWNWTPSMGLLAVLHLVSKCARVSLCACSFCQYRSYGLLVL
mmetsp:Transcript_25816/g.82021  ORF Transcript_25816/g.82021 Transcript_25816/m.82021 type:complete len:278 (+) Transcript_25816:763-1596(+)